MKLPVAILDYEASSLSDNSYPIEAGWAVIAEDLSVTSGGVLIRPQPRWTDWSFKAEQIHGVHRALLLEQGLPCRQVAAHLDGLFAGLPGPVLSADPDFENFWSDRLYGAAGIARGWTIAALRQALDAELASLGAGDRFSAAERLATPRPHRAEADALLFAELLADLRRRNRVIAGAH